MQISLTDLEGSLVCKLCGGMDHTLRSCPRRNRVSKSHANQASTTTVPPGPHKSDLRCFKCGGNHRLSRCPRASEEEKKRIYNEKFPDGPPPRRRPPLDQSSKTDHPSKTHQSNATQSTKATKPKSTSPKPESVLKVKAKKTPAWAKQAQAHKAKYAGTRHHAHVAVARIQPAVAPARPEAPMQPEEAPYPPMVTLPDEIHFHPPNQPTGLHSYSERPYLPWTGRLATARAIINSWLIHKEMDATLERNRRERWSKAWKEAIAPCLTDIKSKAWKEAIAPCLTDIKNCNHALATKTTEPAAAHAPDPHVEALKDLYSTLDTSSSSGSSGTSSKPKALKKAKKLQKYILKEQIKIAIEELTTGKKQDTQQVPLPETITVKCDSDQLPEDAEKALQHYAAPVARSVQILPDALDEDHRKAYHTVVQPHESNPEHSSTPIVQWLIDSGCSNHMTPYAEDFIGDMQPSACTVEVATGVIVGAPFEGTVKVELNDIYNQDHTCFVLMHNVLYVPGLNQRLISVRQWNATGGNVHFEMEHCILTVCDAITGECMDYAVKPPYFAEDLHTPEAHQSGQAALVLQGVELSLLHRRLGHRSLPALVNASDHELWNDAKVTFGNDRTCDDCKITTSRKKNRGDTPTENALQVTAPGQAATMDIVPNLETHGLTPGTHCKYYLLICDVFSRFTVLLGMKDKRSHTLLRTLLIWMATYQTAETELFIGPLSRVRTDADPSFTSEEFLEGCALHHIRLSHAAPRHQEMNGLAERNWQSIRELAFSMMVHAHVGDEFYDFALNHAWKVFNCLPVRTLEIDGRPATPYEKYYGEKPSITKFRVLFCPVIVGIGEKRGPASSPEDEARRIRHRRNTPERAVRGIHVGLPERSEGYLVYIPSMNSTVISTDVSFDENFETTHARLASRTRFAGGIPLQPHPQDITDGDQVEVVGFHVPLDQRGELDHNEGGTPQLSAIPPSPSSHLRQTPSQTTPPVYFDVQTAEDMDREVEEEIEQEEDLNVQEWIDQQLEQEQPNASESAPKSVSWNDNLVKIMSYSKKDPSSKMRPLRRSTRLMKTSQAVVPDYNDTTKALATYASKVIWEMPSLNHALRTELNEAYQELKSAMAVKLPDPKDFEKLLIDDMLNEDDVKQMPGHLFEPAPMHWKSILNMPPHLRKFWISSFKEEWGTLKRMNTFKHATKPEHAPLVPVTVKCRVKLQSNGMIDKLKTRICLRGDMQDEKTDFDTWCAIGNFRGLRKFAASASSKRVRIYQLDFIGAFLQSHTQHETYVILPPEWAELIPEDIEWFGRPLLLVKALYGDVTANKCWDDELSNWLTNGHGFRRCLSEPSIFIKKENGHELVLINAVDDQLYYSTSDEMRLAFEDAVKKKYDVDLMGQAHWYLQSRIAQGANFDITIDQSRYIALICNRFLPGKGVDNVSDAERTRYSAPLPYDFIATKEDRSETYLDVTRLEEEFGFEYASVIGMLIYLMNTAFILHFAISKLAKFNALPGRRHFKAVRHLLNYLRCNHLRFGITYYSDVQRSPIYQLVKKFTKARPDAPLMLFTDSSWQDCKDTGRSTGCFLIFHQGGLIDGGSFVPQPVALSTAESEYNSIAQGMQAVANNRQVIHELHGNHPDTPLSVPFFTDSESALAMGNSIKDTKRTRHIQRRIHYVRDGVASGAFEGHHIEGEVNPADVGTKNLMAEVLSVHHEVMHSTVPP